MDVYPHTFSACLQVPFGLFFIMVGLYFGICFPAYMFGRNVVIHIIVPSNTEDLNHDSRY